MTRSRLDRHDVHVGHEQDGLGRLVFALPGEEQAMPIDDLAGERRVDPGKACFQVAMKRARASARSEREPSRARRSEFGSRRRAVRSLHRQSSSLGIGSTVSWTDLVVRVRITTTAETASRLAAIRATPVRLSADDALHKRSSKSAFSSLGSDQF